MLRRAHPRCCGRDNRSRRDESRVYWSTQRQKLFLWSEDMMLITLLVELAPSLKWGDRQGVKTKKPESWLSERIWHTATSYLQLIDFGHCEVLIIAVQSLSRAICWSLPVKSLSLLEIWAHNISQNFPEAASPWQVIFSSVQRKILLSHAPLNIAWS